MRRREEGKKQLPLVWPAGRIARGEKKKSFTKKHSPTPDFYGFILPSTSLDADKWIQCEGYDEPGRSDKRFQWFSIFIVQIDYNQVNFQLIRGSISLEFMVILCVWRLVQLINLAVVLLLFNVLLPSIQLSYCFDPSFSCVVIVTLPLLTLFLFPFGLVDVWVLLKTMDRLL